MKIISRATIGLMLVSYAFAGKESHTSTVQRIGYTISGKTPREQDGIPSLIEAIERGDTGVVLWKMRSNPQLAQVIRTSDYANLLHILLSNRHAMPSEKLLSMMTILSDAGVSFRHSTRRSTTPLHLAARTRDAELLALASACDFVASDSSIDRDSLAILLKRYLQADSSITVDDLVPYAHMQRSNGHGLLYWLGDNMQAVALRSLDSRRNYAGKLAMLLADATVIAHAVQNHRLVADDQTVFRGYLRRLPYIQRVIDLKGVPWNVSYQTRYDFLSALDAGKVDKVAQLVELYPGLAQTYWRGNNRNLLHHLAYGTKGSPKRSSPFSESVACKLLNILVDAGADVIRTDHRGHTPAFYAFTWSQSWLLGELRRLRAIQADPKTVTLKMGRSGCWFGDEALELLDNETDGTTLPEDISLRCSAELSYKWAY